MSKIIFPLSLKKVFIIFTVFSIFIIGTTALIISLLSINKVNLLIEKTGEITDLQSNVDTLKEKISSLEIIDTQTGEEIDLVKLHEQLQEEIANQINALDIEQGVKGDTGEKGEPGEKGDTGEQGIQGPAGPKGDKGDTGVAGTNGVSGWESRIVTGYISPSSSKNLDASCTSGKKVLGGGCLIGADGGNHKVVLEQSYPLNETLWRCNAYNANAGVDVSLYAYAICGIVQ